MNLGKLILDRRNFFPLASALAVSGFAGWQYERRRPVVRRGRPSVAVLAAASYEADLVSVISDGIRACRFPVEGRRVLLKPKLEWTGTGRISNTHPRLIAAAHHAFASLGAKEVAIGAGPNFRRDTLTIAEDAGYRSEIPQFDRLFTDLNLDDVSPVAGVIDGPLYLPDAALRADLVVSIGKMSTHPAHGVALSMENLLGMIPGAVYGWPKSAAPDSEIPELITGLAAYFCRSFAIVDAIEAVEGEGAGSGTQLAPGAIVMGPEAAAVDATCCRLMGIDPDRIPQLEKAAALWSTRPDKIEFHGEGITARRKQFALPAAWKHARLADS
jgi:uncharacterized protein (DUF362 family)